MKVRILGNNGPYPGAGGACSSYLLNAGGKKILMDAGSGSLSNLMKLMTPDEIDCIILSHLHWDHMTDIPVLYYYLHLLKIKGMYNGKIDMYMPGTPEDMVSLIKKLELFNIHILNNDTTFSIDGCSFTFKRMTHPIESYAARAEFEEKSFVYTGDTTLNQELPEFAGECSLLLADSAFLDNQLKETSPHMSAAQCAAVAGKAGAKRLVLTHQNPFIEASLYEKEADAIFPGAHMAVLMEELEV